MEPHGSMIETEPYCEALGIQVAEISDTGARLVIPFKEANSNPGKILHGGVAASAIDVAALAVARAALESSAAPLHTAALDVVYLAAAVGEAVTADAKLLRKGRELCFVDVSVATQEGKPVARGISTVRGRFGGSTPASCPAIGDDGSSDPGPMGSHLPKRVPFIGGRGMRIENMASGRSRISMPFQETNADAHGGVHEGAILALLDTTGAMAAWATTGPGAFKASTVGIQAQLRAPAGKEELVAYGTTLQRDREIFWCAVEVASRPDGRIIASGTVLYRIVAP